MFSRNIARQYFRETFPWTRNPLIVSAPMLGASTPELAKEVSKAGGIGFIAGGNDGIHLDRQLSFARSLFTGLNVSNIGGFCQDSKYNQRPVLEAFDYLPIGIGFQNWNCKLNVALEVTKKHKPAAVWLYAPKKTQDLKEWALNLRSISDGKVSIWVQVGTVQEALDVEEMAKPDVLVVQGADAGGHGLARSASIISLLPEISDAIDDDIPLLAAGGIVDKRGVAAALCLGASGAVMGTRFLASKEAQIPEGWKRELVGAVDGGISTGHSTLCDRLKETVGWPEQYNGRFLLNKSYGDEMAGMTDEENIRLYKEELKKCNKTWGPNGRMVAYSGTGVGLIHNVQPAEQIVNLTRHSAMDILGDELGYLFRTRDYNLRDFL